MNQIAQHGLFFDDVRVVLDVADPGHSVHQRGQIRCAAGGFQFAAALQFFGEGHKINGALRFAQHDHLRKDVAMVRQKEVFGLQRLNSHLQDVVIQQDGAENGFLSVDVAGRRPLEEQFRRQAWAVATLTSFAFISLLKHGGLFQAERKIILR